MSRCCILFFGGGKSHVNKTHETNKLCPSSRGGKYVITPFTHTHTHRVIRYLTQKGDVFTVYEMKDAFYERNMEDIKEYLNTWLDPVDSQTEFEYDNKKWRMTHGFQRGFYSHALLKSEDGKYAFNVVEQEKQLEHPWKPNMGVYDSYEDLIDGVAKIYFVLWGLDLY